MSISRKLAVRRLIMAAVVCAILPGHAAQSVKAQSVNCGSKAASDNYVAASRNADARLMASLAGRWFSQSTNGPIQNNWDVLQAADGSWQGTLRECNTRSGACEDSPVWGYLFAWKSSDGAIGIGNNIAGSKYGASCGMHYLRRPNPDTLVNNSTGVVSKRQR